MSVDRPRILLYGGFGEASFEYTWLTWLEAQGYPTQAFDYRQCVKRLASNRYFEKVLWRFGSGPLAAYVSRELQRAAATFGPDLVLVVSGQLVTKQALQAMRSRLKASLFHYYGEDFFNSRTTTRTLREAAPYYDWFFTTKSFNVAEMAALGMTRVVYSPHAYRENCHYPVKVGKADAQRCGSDLVFVGTWETERAAVLETLEGFNLRVWGNLWQQVPRESWLRACVQGRAVYCAELSAVLGSSKICLSFLRKANRDQHTSRTFEIPACGAFQLSERTDEILGFFVEGKEIECFSSAEELKDKACYYLAHDHARCRIARAGFERVRRESYGHRDRLRVILSYYGNAKLAG